MQFERDQILQVTSVYPKIFQGAQQLTGSVSTKCQFVQDDNFKDLPVTEKDFLEDHDFDIEEDLADGEPFQINKISDAYRYLCCSSEGCRKKKKILDNKCPICSKESNNTYGCRITVEAENCNTNVCTTASLFNDDVCSLFSIDQHTLASSDDLLYNLSLKLPVHFTAKRVNNKFYNMKKM
ncbi:uncharacterized protein LOC125666110 [Ostrea edulis]|uniref:uncharacterized protein LOC125666110 n=1 Tax=Ostrea edulis TaxID=37623 RepID=UPI0024AF49C5|nr:uncharacterized protein LOC125666110 [Ostrea edulis]